MPLQNTPPARLYVQAKFPTHSLLLHATCYQNAPRLRVLRNVASLVGHAIDLLNLDKFGTMRFSLERCDLSIYHSRMHELLNKVILSSLQTTRVKVPGSSRVPLRRGDPQLPSGSSRSGQPETGPRPVHHARPVWLSKPIVDDSKPFCCTWLLIRIEVPRTSMRLCVLMSSASSITIGNNTLTIRTFLFSPPPYQTRSVFGTGCCHVAGACTND